MSSEQYVDVLITGCFDIIHAGHVNMFETIKRSIPNSKITVFLDSDARVKETKGDSRPIIDENNRKFMLQSIKYIDDVIIFTADEVLIKYCAEKMPIRVLGKEYKSKQIIGEEYCSLVLYHNKTINLSTTDIINKIISSYSF